MAKKNLYINDISLGNYGIYISSDTVLNTPEFDYVGHEVPARNGTVLQYNKRLSNVVRKFTCYVPLQGNVQTAISNVKKIIYANPGYLKISSDYEPDTYQLGYLAQAIEVRPFIKYKSATFDLYFSCQPQKYFNTSYVSIPHTNITYLRNVLTRSNSFVQTLFDNLLPEYIPSDNSFMVFQFSNTISSGTSITNLSGSWSGGDSFMAAFIGADYLNDGTDLKQILSYSNQGISSVSTLAMSNGKIAFIVPTRTTGTYTFTYTSNGQTRTISSGDLADSTVSLKNADAMGVNATLLATFDMPGGTLDMFYTNAYVLKYYFANEEKGEATIVWRTDLSEDLEDTLVEYSTVIDTLDNFEVSIDLNTNNVLLKKTGKPDISVNNIFEIHGKIPATGVDEIRAQCFYYATPGRLYGDWWTL